MRTAPVAERGSVVTVRRMVLSLIVFANKASTLMSAPETYISGVAAYRSQVLCSIFTKKTTTYYNLYLERQTKIISEM